MADAVGDMGSSHRSAKRKTKKDRKAQKVAVREAGDQDGMDIDEQPQASSSKVTLSDHSSAGLKKKSSKRSLKAANGVQDAMSVDGSVGAGRTKLSKSEKKKLKQDLKKGKGRQQDDMWDYSPIAQDEASTIAPLWSRDGKFYFTVSRTSVHIHSTTGPDFARLSTLSSTHREGHRRRITGVLLHPTNPLQLITSSIDGTIKVWDWVEGKLLRTLVMTDKGNVGHLCVGQVGGVWYIFCTLAVKKDDIPAQRDGFHLRHRIVRIPLNCSAEDRRRNTRPIGKLSQAPCSLFISPRNNYLVVLSSNKAYTYSLPSNPSDAEWSPICVKFISDQPFTCGTFAPDRLSTITGGKEEEEWFATGDIKGVIRLWHGLSTAFKRLTITPQSNSDEKAQMVNPDMEKRLPTTSLHWHAHAVGALAFTPSGAQLLSVGEESVLVQWHLASGKREYIPRLGGKPIIHLGVKEATKGGEEEWWMGSADGSEVRVGAASGQVSTIGQGIRRDPLRPTAGLSNYPLTLYPPTNSLLVPSSHPSTLQFIDPISSSVQFELEVSPSNRIARRDQKEIQPVSVEHVAFTNVTSGGVGRWMATVEGRKEDEVEGGGMVKLLKLWKWNGNKYMVNTQYPRPHDKMDLVSISFSTITPSRPQPLLLTAAVDGTTKIWTLRESRRPNQGKGREKDTIVEQYWSCRSTFSYRSMPVYSAIFSPDSTMVALAHGPVVTLWDVDSNVLLRTLEGGLEDMVQLSFVGDEGRYLVTGGNSQGLAVWDLLSCELLWTLPTHSSLQLQSLPSLPCYIVSQAPDTALWRTTFTIFSATSPIPLRSVSIRVKVNRLLTLSSPSLDALQFAGVSSNGEINRFGDDVESNWRKARTITRKEEKNLSIWQEMFGKDAFLDLTDSQPTQTKDVEMAMTSTSGERPEEVFDGPSHTLPPPSLLFDSFMDRLLSTRPGAIAETDGDKADGGIVYDVAEVEREDPVREQMRNREVTEEDVQELEGFFKFLLTASTSATAGSQAKARNLPNGIPSRLANGTEDHESRDEEEPTSKSSANGIKSKSSASKKNRTPSQSIKKNSAATPVENDPEPESDTDATPAKSPKIGSRSRGQKRKAPKEA